LLAVIDARQLFPLDVLQEESNNPAPAAAEVQNGAENHLGYETNPTSPNLTTVTDNGVANHRNELWRRLI
jgi:hypothetical protein